MTKAPAPVVSVLMTAYNRESYLGDAIESVLASHFHEFELIIVDDCSTDDTVAVANRYVGRDPRVKLVINERNLGDYPNRNRAASLATGKYLKYLDSDNVMYRYGLASVVDCMNRFPEAGLGLLSKSDPARPYPVCVSPAEAYRENLLERFDYFGRAPDSAIIRRDVFESSGGFSGENLIGDLEMWMRLAKRTSVVKLTPYFGWDRTHPGQQKNVDPLVYRRKTCRVILEMVRASDCPLSGPEVRVAIRKLRRELLRDSLVSAYQRRPWDAWRFLNAYIWPMWR